MPSIVVADSKKDLKDFINLPYLLYKNDKNWVPPLKIAELNLLSRQRHPFHKHAEVKYFLAKDGKRNIGRIAAIINYLHNEFHQEKAGFFGFFECIDEDLVAKKLFDAAEDWLRKKGAEFSQGPCNPSTNETCGLLIEGFKSPPTIMMPYNPPFYTKLIESAGYRKIMDLFAYTLTKDHLRVDKIKRFDKLLKRKNSVYIRNVRLERFDEELALIRRIYNNAWSKNWGFVPMTDEEFSYRAKELKHIILPEFAYIAEVGGNPVGFALAIPDINQILKRIGGRLFPLGIFYLLFHLRKIKALRVIALGIIQEYQKLGIGPLFYLRLLEKGLKRGYESAELSWILETNELMNRAIQRIGGRIYKRYRIYRKYL
jgi:GNAT superfamily N-acetyltransferase